MRSNALEIQTCTMTRAKSKPVQLGWPTFQVYKKYSTGVYTHVKSTLALGFNGPTPCKGTVCYDYSRYTLERFGPRVQLLRACAATIVGA